LHGGGAETRKWANTACALAKQKKQKKEFEQISTNNLVKKVHLVVLETIVLRRLQKQKNPAQEAHLATSKTGK